MPIPVTTLDHNTITIVEALQKVEYWNDEATWWRTHNNTLAAEGAAHIASLWAKAIDEALSS